MGRCFRFTLWTRQLNARRIFPKKVSMISVAGFPKFAPDLTLSGGNVKRQENKDLCLLTKELRALRRRTLTGNKVRTLAGQLRSVARPACQAFDI